MKRLIMSAPPATRQTAKAARPAARYALMGVLVVLIGGAVWVWANRVPSEAYLKAATLVQLQKAFRAYPESAAVAYYLGVRQEEAQIPAEAFDAYARACDLAPTNADYCLAAARLAGQVGGAEGAMNILTAFAGRNPNSAAVQTALAEFYLQRGAFEPARMRALNALKLAPQSAEAWYLFGAASRGRGASIEAEDALRKAIALDAKNWRYPQILAVTLAESRRYADALPLAQEAVRLGPTQSEPCFNVGKLQLALSRSPADIATARRTLEGCADKKPSLTMLYVLIARCYGAAGDWKNARSAAERAASLAPDDPRPLLEIARAAARLGDAKTAQTAQREYRQRRNYPGG